MAMLIRRTGETTWRTPEVSTYTSEIALQVLLQQSPELLPGLADSGLLAVREVYVPGSGPADIVCIDLSWNVTVCECKLHGNSDMRRTIVGQALAYAAGLWRMSYDEFDGVVSSRIDRSLADAMAEIALEIEPEWDEEAFRNTVATNLRNGSFRVIFAVDRITEELKRIVEYLNEHSGAGVEVLAIELGFVADSGVEILTPTVYGQESVHRKASPMTAKDGSLMCRVCDRTRPATKFGTKASGDREDRCRECRDWMITRQKDGISRDEAVVERRRQFQSEPAD